MPGAKILIVDDDPDLRRLLARDPKPEEERLLASAAAAFIQKPIDYERLLAAIARALGDEDGP